MVTALKGLEAAFPASKLESEGAFGEGGTTYLSGQAFIDGARGRTWQELGAELVEDHHDALLFFTPERFVEYLPAYVAAVARGGPAIRNLPTFLRGALTLTRDPQWFDARIERLTPAQRQAIADVLVALEAATENRLDKQDLTEVVDSYWRSVAGKGKNS